MRDRVGSLRRELRRSVVTGLAALAAAAVPGAAVAAPVTLADGVAVVEVDFAAPEGVQALRVNGIAHLRSHGFWIRIGEDGPETSLDALLPNGASASDTDADGDLDDLVLDFLDPGQRFAVELRLLLEGSAFGPPEVGVSARLRSEIRVENTGGGPLDLHLFAYTDVDLFGSPSDDAAEWLGTQQARATDSTGLAAYVLLQTPAATAREAAVYDAVLASLTDGDPTVLTGALAASGDVTLAALFREELAAGGAFAAAFEHRLEIAPIPEPGPLALLGAGLAALGARRRRGAQEGD